MKLLNYLKENKTYIIAEMSGNHAGKIEKAIDIIKVAKDAGADCVKIQTYTADTLTINCDRDEFKTGKGLWNGTTLYKLYQKAYTPWEWTSRLKEETEKLGMDFLSTPFDFSAVDYLEGCGIDFYKVASMEIVDIPLIKKIALTGKPVIISCGMASIDDIDLAIKVFKKYSDSEIILLKCCSAYPSKYSDMNISTIPDMIKRFNTHVGLSDHSRGTIASIVAVAQGACIIEKHICLRRNDKTVDNEFSLDKEEFKQLVVDIRNAEMAIGRPNYEPSLEEANSFAIRRSLYAVKKIKNGERFSSENIKSIRPSNGLHTKYYEFLIKEGHASKDIDFGTPLSQELVIEELKVDV